jgi:hypothetical protein
MCASLSVWRRLLSDGNGFMSPSLAKIAGVSPACAVQVRAGLSHTDPYLNLPLPVMIEKRYHAHEQSNFQPR